MKNIYVICPYGLVTGGPDALHQIVFYMKKLGLNAHIVYSDIKSYKYKIPAPYQIYVDKYMLLKDIEDSKQNVIIVPETESHILDKYSSIKKYIWWLSVDNDINSSGFINKITKIIKKIRLKNLKKLYKIFTLKNFLQHKKYEFNNSKDVEHLCASYYAYDYVSKRCNNEKKVHLCIEPVSKLFLDKSSFSEKNKKNVILYNPKKNYKFTKKIIENCSEFKFIPLKGYNQEQLIDLYSTSKLYIDFGSFPGAERIPKEAVINGCCIITGRFGASAFHNDVPINEEYKFEGIEKNIDIIKEKIIYIMNNYEKCISDFNEYRDTVWNLENNFMKQIERIFIKNK